jgi:hypothetical protein
LIGLVSKLLVAYFYDIKVFQKIYSTYHKFNEGLDGLMFLLTNVFNPHSYVFVKNCKLDFGQMNEFFVYFIMFLPHESPDFLGQKCR